MTALFAILVSGLFLSQLDEPLRNCPFSFTSDQGKKIEGTTDKDGRFHIELEPGTYQLKIGADTEGRPIKIEKSTPNLRIYQRALPALPVPSQKGDFPLPLGPLA